MYPMTISYFFSETGFPQDYSTYDEKESPWQWNESESEGKCQKLIKKRCANDIESEKIIIRN